MLKHPRRLGILAIALLGFGLLILSALEREQPSAPVILLDRPLSPPLMLRDRLEAWIPRGNSWAWAYRLGDLLLGRRKPLQFDQEVVVLELLQDARALQVGLNSPVFFHSSAPSVWFVNSNELKAVRAHLQHLAGPVTSSRCKISTAEGVGASLFAGQNVVLNGSTNEVGLRTEYFARVGNKGVDLFTSLLFSEPVTNDIAFGISAAPAIFLRTNLDLAARLQVPQGCGVFLLSADSAKSNQVAVIIGVH